MGRPADPEIGKALCRAGHRAMLQQRFSTLTVDSLIRETGVSKGAFYRRFPTLGHLAFAVIREHFGGGEPVDTGTLIGDLLAVQRADLAVFTDPLMRNNLPGLLEASHSDPDVYELYVRGFAGPRRARVAAIVDAAVARGEIAQPDVDPGVISDLLVGPLIARVVIPMTGPLDDDLARITAATVDRALRDGLVSTATLADTP